MSEYSVVRKTIIAHSRYGVKGEWREECLYLGMFRLRALHFAQHDEEHRDDGARGAGVNGIKNFDYFSPSPLFRLTCAF